MSIRAKLLEAFNGKSGAVLSGQSLARRLGVSRTAVWKQVQSLRIAGLPVESAGRRGYRLGTRFDNSLARFRGPGWITSHHYLTTISTQTLAKAGAAAGLPEGHLWIAETQSKGRGRLDRFWDSSYGGLWFSLLLRPKLPPARIAPLTLMAGYALRQAVAGICGFDLKLKWPNDLLALTSGGWKKCAGILTEMHGQMDRTDWVVIGIGLNVNNALSAELADRGAALHGLTGRMWPRARILDAFLKVFRKGYERYARDGFAPFRRLYWENYFAPGGPVLLQTGAGRVSGMARGVDDAGAIMIESRRKIRAFSEGEIV